MDDELRRLERAHEANPTDLELIERLIQCRHRMGLRVPGALQEARALPARRFDSPLSLQVQVLKPGADKPLGLGKTPAGGGGLAIPVHSAWWAIPAPPGPLDQDALREQVISEKIPGLSFEKKKLDDRGLARLAGLDLTYLSLKECRRVTDEGLAHVATLRSLGWLDLSATNVSDDGLRQLGALRHLFSLRVWRPPDYTHHRAPPVPGWLDTCPNLMRLDLVNVPLGRRGLEVLVGLTDLKELTLTYCTPEDALPLLGGLTQLETLTLHDDAVGDSVLKALGDLPRLRRLELFSLPGGLLRHLTRNQCLSELRLLGGVTISDAVIETLRAMPMLEQVDFGACEFSLEAALPGLPRRFGLTNQLPPDPARAVLALEQHLDVARVLPRPKARRR